MKKISIIIISFCLLVLTSCDACINYKIKLIENDYYTVVYGYNKSSKKAFIGEIMLDFNQTNPVLQFEDEIEGETVTTLGGVYGTGVSSLFGISFLDGTTYATGIPEKHMELLDQSKKIIEYPIEIDLSKSINQIYEIQLCTCYIEVEDYYLKATYYFNVDEENEAFYAEEGILYNKETNEKVKINTY